MLLHWILVGLSGVLGPSSLCSVVPNAYASISDIGNWQRTSENAIYAHPFHNEGRGSTVSQKFLVILNLLEMICNRTYPHDIPKHAKIERSLFSDRFRIINICSAFWQCECTTVSKQKQKCREAVFVGTLEGLGAERATLNKHTKQVDMLKKGEYC